MPKAMIITVGTGRNRQDIAGALLFSIREQQPDFVRFLVSEISQKETLPIITQSLEIEHDFQITPTINDVDILYENYLQQIKELQCRGFTARDIVADYTSGTKAMSAALLSAAKELTPYNTAFRYPDLMTEPVESEVIDAIRRAERIIEFVRDKIQ